MERFMSAGFALAPLHVAEYSLHILCQSYLIYGFFIASNVQKYLLNLPRDPGSLGPYVLGVTLGIFA